MNTKKLSTSQSVLKKIEKTKILPTPRWYFVVHNVLLWSIGMIFVFCGALFVSLIILVVQNEPWQMHYFFATHTYNIIFALPFLWTVSFVAFIAIAKWTLAKTKNAYRLGLWKITTILLLVSIVFGVLLYSVGIANQTDRIFERHLPMHRSMSARQDKLLHQPLQGRIVGHIDAHHSDTVRLKNNRGNELWNVSIRHLSEQKRRAISINDRVLFFGKNESDVFVACDLHMMQNRADMSRERKNGINEDASTIRKNIIHEGLSATCKDVMTPRIYNSLEKRIQAMKEK